ncbi:MAG: response regulator [Bacteroidota bacterium]
MASEKIKILVIDDNIDNHVTIKALINEAFPGTLTISALSGSQGIEMALVNDPDVILLDIIMPEMDGFEVCRRIKADKNLSNIPVVFVTSLKGEKETRIRALEAGAEAFLAKPIDEIELTAQIRAMLKIKNANIEKLNENKQLASLVEEQLLEIKETQIATLNMLEDVTRENEARKKSEEALIKSEEKYRNIFENVQDVFYQTNLNGIILDISPSIKNLSGISREELLGTPVHSLYHNPEDRQILLDAIQKNGVLKDFELRLKTQTGEVNYVSINARLIYDVNHKPTHIDGALRDIHDRKLAEKKLLELNEELDLRVKQRTAELESANKELETFSYSVSHDLKAPLRHINGFIGLFLENKSTEFNEDELEYLKKVTDAATEMAQLIDALLSFSRLNLAELRKVNINSTDMVQQIIKFFDPDIQNRKITFNVAPLPDIKGDEGLMRQVWTNLISNAIKYTGKKPEAIVDIGGNVTESETTFFIKDNGAGFNMKYADKLFGVFQRLHKTRDFEGVGIGLANVSRIVRRHGGQCRAESTPDQGATFYFSLPNTPHPLPPSPKGEGEFPLH